MKLISLTMALIMVVMEAKSQGKPRFVKAKIDKIDTTDYYIVIRATLTGGKDHMIILSPMDERSNFCDVSKDSTIVKQNSSYRFYVEELTKIKSGEDCSFLLHFQNVFWGNVLLVEQGKLAYIALNMYKNKIYK
jgi:hypothetical protein